MNTRFLSKIALAAIVSFAAFTQPAEARSRYHDDRHDHRYEKRDRYHRPHWFRKQHQHRAHHLKTEMDVQRALARRGFYRGPIDGQIGPQTRASIRSYQIRRGLPVTGRIDRSLLRSLRLA